VTFVGYDPVPLGDAFGAVMTKRLAARGAPLAGMASCANPAAHAARLRGAFPLACDARDMYVARRCCCGGGYY
jgi:hypothetical protein